MRKTLIVLGVAYAAWCVIALVEIVSRRMVGHSVLPGLLANHNGNIAVSGFIMAAAYPGALLAVLARKHESALLEQGARLCVPMAGVLWGAFFILMERMQLYASNVPDAGDIPASVFGMLCGVLFGMIFQRRIIDHWGLATRPRA